MIKRTNSRFACATILGVLTWWCTSVQAVAPTPVPSASPTPRNLRVGAILSLTGSFSDMAQEARNGIELARTEEPPVGGAPLTLPEIIYEDIGPEGSAARVNEAFKKLITVDKVQAIIGDVRSDTSLSLAIPANTYRIPYLMMAVFNMNLPPDNRYSFTLYPKQQSLEKAYEHFFEVNPSLKTISLFCSTSNRGSAFRTVIRDIALAKNLKINDELCGSENAYDFRVNVLRASSSNPDAVFIGFNTELGKRWMDSFNLKPKIIATDDTAVALKLRGFSEQDAEGIYYVDWQLSERFTKDYESKYSASPIYLSYLGYEAMRAIRRGYEKSPYDVASGLKALRYQGSSGEINFMSDQAVNASQAVLKQVKAGRGVVVP